MPTTTALQTITVGGPTVSLIPPRSGAGAVALLVLDNLSPFILQVTVGPDVFWHAPLVETAYELSNAGGQPVNVSAFPDAAAPSVATTGTIAPTWYDAFERAPGRNWPIALSGPAEIAAATAAAILQTGVPNVLQTTQIYRGSLNQNASLTFDVGAYASVSFVGPAFGNSDYSYQFTNAPPGPAQNVVDYDNFAAPATGGAVRLAVLARYLTITNNSTTTGAFITLTGSNRAALARLDSRINIARGDQWSIGGTLAGGSNTLAQLYPAASLQGAAFASFSCTANVPAGRFLLYTPTNTTQPVVLCDTTEMTATGYGNGTKQVTKLIALPVEAYSIVYQSSAAATASGTAAVWFLPMTI